MPTIPRTTELVGVDAVLAAWAEYEAGFRRSRRGNLWRTWDGRTTTVFARSDDRYGWCIADGSETRYSPHGFENEDDALMALGEELGVGT